MIDLTRTSAEAVHDLRHYLEFAERGPIALGEALKSVGGTNSFESDFEEAVAEGLRRRGWSLHTQIGVSKFRIDLGIIHPDWPGRYLVGLECDGATTSEEHTSELQSLMRTSNAVFRLKKKQIQK